MEVGIDEIIELVFFKNKFFWCILLFVIFGEICVWQTFLIRYYIEIICKKSIMIAFEFNYLYLNHRVTVGYGLIRRNSSHCYFTLSLNNDKHVIFIELWFFSVLH